jgi:antitoxin MazE
MKSKLVKIGNSQGVRIPKPLIAQVGIESDIEISVEENRLIISPARQARSGWAEAFRCMAERGGDRLLDEETVATTVWDEEKWEW